MNREKIKGIVIGALIAALYAVLCYISAALNLAYGPLQFRLSEALNILPIFTPYATIGLTVGCIISNIGSTLGPVDMIFGTFATLLSAICVRFFRDKLSYPVLCIFPILFNAIIVGAELKFFLGDVGFFSTALSVALGEAAVIFLIGTPLYLFLKRNNLFDR